MIQQTLNQKANTDFVFKVVKTDNNQILMKYGQAYFPLRSIQKNQVSQSIKNLLYSYPCWHIKQSLLKNKEFNSISKHIVSADTKEIHLEQDEQHHYKNNNFIQTNNILDFIQAIRFSYLKVLHITFTCETNFQQISWLDAPILQEINLITEGCFTSIKPFQKTNLKNLLIINLNGKNSDCQQKMFNLIDFNRTSFFNSKRPEPFKHKTYIPPGTINICRRDFSNINFLAKLQIERLTDFHIPHLILPGNQHHRFTPNADYPWCPQLQFSQSKVYKCLNRKFNNKTIASSMDDYLLGNVYGQQMQIENRMGRQNIFNQNPQNQPMEDDFQSIDSDLDRPIEVQFQNDSK